MAYPLMLYRGGCDVDDYMPVNDEQEEAEAVKEGYARLDLAAVKAGKKAEKRRGRPPKNREVPA